MTDETFTVAVVDPSPARAAIVEEGLRSAGVARVAVIGETEDLLARLAAINPDVVVIDVASPSRDLLEQLFHVTRVVARQVAMFVDRTDPAMMEAAVDAGVSAYLVDGLRPERVKSIIDVAILRFNAFCRHQRELVDARTELADRKVIERAKGILMQARGLSESEAYALPRRKAMNEKRRLADIARAIVTASELLG
ncbi:ANTAR domain-containing response regulator [Salinarimonas soli]|uniref:ANTAR domain-containing protein n=1 Tax=Salinarimonas soli TaxID=1638099 RepID=A0A5B2V9K7_9HYPH|nr:ANTAR domain-containing protein [Salinarimonas soli]KAA2235664.1 ANTAR domain-containing protein [Salinarimonas soli]